MKKKFIAVSMVLGALALSSTTLTSCVDDNESASVTAIRDAKAAQLTALANYQQAQADAEKIVAEAEAAIRNADAKAQEIANELQNLELEKAKATLETDIAAAQAKAEAALKENQVALEKAKASLILAADQADAMTKVKINNLLEAADAIMNGGEYKVMNLLYTNENYNNYNYQAPNYEDAWETITISVANSINGYKEAANGEPEQKGLSLQLIEKKSEKTKAEYDLTDVKLKIAEAVREKQIDLATQEALLAEYQKYSNEDLEAAQKIANEASNKATELLQPKNEAWKLYYNDQSVSTAWTNVQATEVESFYNLSDNMSKYGPNGSVAKAINFENPESETVIVKYDDGTVGEHTISYNYQITVNSEAIDAAILNEERNIELYKQQVADAKEDETNGKKDDAQVTVYYDESKTVVLYQGTYKALNDAIKAAQEAWEEDKGNQTLLDNFKTLEGYKATYEADLAKAVTDAEDDQKGAEEELQALKDLKTMLTGEAYTTYTTVYKAYVDAEKAIADVYVAYLKAEHNYSVQNQLANNLTTMLANYTDWAELISKQEVTINQTKKEIAAMTSNGTSDPTKVDPSDSSKNGYTEAQKQAYIDALDAEIKRLEKEISIKETMYQNYMDQVEALLQGEEAPAPETPAEGEETPAE